MIEALDAFFDAIYEGCTKEVGFNRWSMIDESVQGWFESYKPWSTVISIMVGLFIGSVATVFTMVLSTLFSI